MSMFAAPAAPSSGIQYTPLAGALLLVKVIGFEEHVPTVHTTPGEKSPAVKATVTVLDGPQAEANYPDTLIFPKVLVSQLKDRVGQLVLGRLSTGQAKPGQTAPWVLDEATPADIALAEAFVNRTVRPQVGTVSSEAPF